MLLTKGKDWPFCFSFSFKLEVQGSHEEQLHLVASCKAVPQKISVDLGHAIHLVVNFDLADNFPDGMFFL